MTSLQWLRLGVAAWLLLAFTTPTWAETYPDRPVRLIVGYAPGGATDNLARSLAKGMSERLKQTVLVENRPGASTMLAAQFVQSAKPDGYTIFMVDVGTLALNQFLFASLPYDPKKFEPIAQVAVNALGLLVPSNSKYQTVADFVEAAKSKQLAVASAGLGNITHLASEQFQSRFGVKFTHVPYKGSAPALLDLMSGQVEAYFSDVPSAISHVRSGRVRYLAMMSDKRVEALPEVQTFQEAGYSGLVTGAWIGLVAPPGTDPAIRQRLADVVIETMNSPEKVAWMRSQSSGHSPRTAAQFKALIDADTQRYETLIKTIGLKLD